jgi:hypothetical protein
VIVYALRVDVGTADESAIAFRKSVSKLIAYSIRFRRVNLAGLERLTQMITDNVVLALVAPSQHRVLPLREKKLRVNRQRVTLIRRKPFAAVGLFGIFDVISCSSERGGNGTILARVKRE